MSADFFPRRVVSLQPSATDMLARLGLVERVAACTRHCAEIVPDAASGRVIVADSWSAQVEEIVAARPDLVIASVPYQAEAVAQILKAGARFLGLAPRTLADIYGDIAAIAGIMGVQERGARVVAEMQGEIEAIRQRAQEAPERPRAFCEEWGKPIMASEPWVAELVEAAGGKFIGTPGRPHDAEGVRAAAPEVLIFAWTGAGDRVPMESLVRERGWLDLPAVRAQRVFALRDALLNTPSPVLVEGMKALAWALHPKCFPAVAGIRQIEQLL